jgi:hypothetical protein
LYELDKLKKLLNKINEKLFQKSWKDDHIYLKKITTSLNLRGIKIFMNKIDQPYPNILKNKLLDNYKSQK